MVSLSVRRVMVRWQRRTGKARYGPLFKIFYSHKLLRFHRSRSSKDGSASSSARRFRLVLLSRSSSVVFSSELACSLRPRSADAADDDREFKSSLLVTLYDFDAERVSNSSSLASAVSTLLVAPLWCLLLGLLMGLLLSNDPDPFSSGSLVSTRSALDLCSARFCCFL